MIFQKFSKSLLCSICTSPQSIFRNRQFISLLLVWSGKLIVLSIVESCAKIPLGWLHALNSKFQAFQAALMNQSRGETGTFFDGLNAATRSQYFSLKFCLQQIKSGFALFSRLIFYVNINLVFNMKIKCMVLNISSGDYLAVNIVIYITFHNMNEVFLGRFS